MTSIPALQARLDNVEKELFTLGNYAKVSEESLEKLILATQAVSSEERTLQQRVDIHGSNLDALTAKVALHGATLSKLDERQCKLEECASHIIEEVKELVEDKERRTPILKSKEEKPYHKLWLSSLIDFISTFFTNLKKWFKG